MNKIVSLVALKTYLLAAVTAGFVLALTGCNTVQGMGKDIERGGEAIQKSAK